MQEVIVYSAGFCGGCKVVKKILTENGIKFTEVDVTSPEGSILAKEANIKNIPVTFIGTERFIGSSPEVINLILEAAT